ncbi:Thiolase, N-terminal domain-containing protein [Phaeosphaeria sp. MPI-PUGE-AT-0046c]|nr:Thiolase, N-terminal domain-containing protein [Phaeosphaeria sp. MPI-PUGE-AT-0046c]
MTERLKSIVSQMTPSTSALSAITTKNPDDVVITLALRTPLTKAHKGGMKDTKLDGIMVKTLKAVIKQSNLDPALVEDICCGNVSDAKAAYYVRAAMLAAGFPNTTSGSSLNRFCSSGLKAVQDIANQIAVGSIEIGLAMGAESMTTGGDRLERPFVDEILENKESMDCMQPMGQTSENARQFAAESYRRAEVAQKAGWFDDEIAPITTTIKDPKTGEEKQVTLTKDEGIRAGTTFESLQKLKPAFLPHGDKSHAGNSSQLTDGAAAILMMKRSTAEKLGQPILAKYVGATVAGLAPRIMGIGPSVAIPKLLTKFGLTLDDIDLIEINEAFASMAVYCLETLKIDHSKLNIVTGLSECRRQKKKVLLTSMCIGTGMGMAGLFVNEQNV